MGHSIGTFFCYLETRKQIGGIDFFVDRGVEKDELAVEK